MREIKFNVSNKDRLNTSTGEVEQTPQNKNAGITPASNGGGSGSSAKYPTISEGTPGHQLTADPEFVAGISQASWDNQDRLSAIGQGWWNKLGRTTGRAVGKGIVGAVDPVTSGIGAVLSYIDEESGEYMKGLTAQIQDNIDNGMKVHEEELDEDASFGEKLARFSTVESIVKSAVEFGAMGIGVGALTKGIGMMAVRAGGSLEGVATGLAGVLDKTGRMLTKPHVLASIGKTNIHTSAVVNGMITNHLEGRVMADETEKSLEALYAPVLYNSEVDQEIKDSIYKNINDAGNRIIATNTALALTDIIGFSRLFRYTKQGEMKQGFWKYLKDNMKVLSASEGLEEITQSIIQTDAEYKNIQDAEIETQHLRPQKIEGLDYTGDKEIGEDTLLYMASPEKAQEALFKQAQSNVEYIVGLATSHEALIEGIAGFVGGGPQWLITGAPSAIANRKQKKASLEAQAGDQVDFDTKFQGFLKNQLLSDTELNATIDELHGRFDGTEKEHLATAVENYAMAKLAKDAVANNRSGNLQDMLHETRKAIQKDLASGDMTKEEAIKYTERLDKTEGYIKQFYKRLAMHGSQEILAKDLKRISIEEAIKSVKAAKAGAVQGQSNAANVDKEELNDFFSMYDGTAEAETTNEEPTIPFKQSDELSKTLVDMQEAPPVLSAAEQQEVELNKVGKPKFSYRLPSVKSIAKDVENGVANMQTYKNIQDKQTRLKKLMECL